MKKKNSITLRRRLWQSGRTSLYLDIYQGGVRTTEALHLYLIPEHSRKDKEQNRQTMMLAEAICAKRIVEMRNGEHGFANRIDEPLLQYVQRITDRHHGSSRRRYVALLTQIKRYERRTSMMVGDITPAWFLGFLAFIERQGYSKNTVVLYSATLRYVINQAYREGLFPTNPIANIKGKGFEDTNRIYLTVDEVRQLVATPCPNEVSGRAFIFGCLTGLRHCDIRALTWGDVSRQGGYTRIIFRQIKTHGQEYLDISEQAASLMGERRRDTDAVFPLLGEFSVRNHVARWAKLAGLSKRVTFHSSRHTFAVLQLEAGTDIYTVSKLLGHRELATTQIYAKVLDKAKRDAVDRMPNLLNAEKRI